MEGNINKCMLLITAGLSPSFGVASSHSHSMLSLHRSAFKPSPQAFVGLFFFFFFFIVIKITLMWLQMGSRMKKTVMSENVRSSLHGWMRRVRARNNGAPFQLLTATSTSSLSSLDLMAYEMEKIENVASTSKEGSYSEFEDTSTPSQPVSEAQSPSFEPSTSYRLHVTNP